ncbi:hypothetical protein ASE86_07470 [Sphingomonas sp. Leaf33]|uniref:hypothetical protein n=1 Tax=Sphingomonas sp. Leaf33 TaxID=1736215 RepID=UPI0006F7A9BC|nr:hypothetical protein [Sphingomonas sp. Leaf33]KQN26003.1 hypothetical protein ASE86_07470 [Sphingomonas sp. Leaf33]
MAAKRPARPALYALAGTLAAVAIGGAAVLLHRRYARRADSIEPRHMPGSASDIHVAGGRPVNHH